MSIDTDTTRFRIARNDILSLLNDRQHRVYKKSELAQVLSQNREHWRLTSSFTTEKLIKHLEKDRKLTRIDLPFPSRKEIRYVYGPATVFEIALTLRLESYLSHHTALYLHQLTEQFPKVIYVNVEQAPPPKRQKDSLTQHSLDNAFKGQPRLSKTVAHVDDYAICILNSMGIGGLGIEECRGPGNEWLRVTDLERTLIDAAVRPVYSGGVHEVLRAYRNASDKLSINRLASILRGLDYIYPYHQAIGFYLEKSGVYRDSQIKLLREITMEFDFYLTHKMIETEYSAAWRLHYPKGL